MNATGTPNWKRRLVLSAAALALWQVGSTGGLLSAAESAPPDAEPAKQISTSLALPDVAGRRVRPFADASNRRAFVFVILANECPISNRAIPELRRLKETYSGRGV